MDYFFYVLFIIHNYAPKMNCEKKTYLAVFFKRSQFR